MLHFSTLCKSSRAMKAQQNELYAQYLKWLQFWSPEYRIECALCFPKCIKPSITAAEYVTWRLRGESAADCSPKSSPLLLSASSFQNVLTRRYKITFERLSTAVMASVREQEGKWVWFSQWLFCKACHGFVQEKGFSLNLGLLFYQDLFQTGHNHSGEKII